MAIFPLVKFAAKELTKKNVKESSKEVAKKGTELIGRRPNRDMGMVEDVTPKQKTDKRGGKGAMAAGAIGAGAVAGGVYAATRGKDDETKTAGSKRAESGRMSSVKEKEKSSDTKRSTFSAAFKEARSDGDKTFMFEGKKYTTELASEKRAPKISDKDVEEMRKENLSRINDMLSETKPTEVREGRNENIDEDTRKRAMSSVANMNMGGMMRGYAKGGMIMANCGASVPPAQKAKK